VVGLGFLSLTGFDDVFLIFHQVSFSNDLWILDPKTDYLIMLFPLRFWFDITLKVAVVSLIISIFTVATSAAAQAVTNHRNRKPNGT
jgi:integral membrane protein (TIGR01906 family)